MEQGAQPIKRENVRERVPIGAMDVEMWKLLLDRSKAPERIVHELAGETYNMERRCWAKTSRPMLNDDGIKWVVGEISDFFDVSALATSIDEDEVKRFTEEAMTPIISKFVMCRKDFKIDRSDLFPLSRKIERIIFMALSSSRKGFLPNLLVPQYERRETYEPQKEEHGALSFLSMFTGRGKK